nr:odorant binding protein 6 [Monochamus saltuarius]
MMSIKVALVIISVCALVWAQESNLQAIMKYHNECKAETNVDDSLVTGLLTGKFPDDPTLKQHMFCMSKKLGIQDEAGEIQKEAMQQKIGKVISDDAKIAELTEKCSVEQGSPEDTAFEMAKCIYEGTHP